MADRQSTEMHPQTQVLTGRRYGRLVVVGFSHRVWKNGYRSSVKFWNCRCDCGANVTIQANNLTSGNSKSCGCLRGEIQKKNDGLHEDPLYDIYMGMVARCHNEKNKAYPRYGGRGIFVCDRWRNGENGKSGLQCFIEDVSPRPGDLTLDRIDNMSGYRPGNTRWITRKAQSYNRRDNIYLEHNGETILLKDLARRSGMTYTTVLDRWRRGFTGDALIQKQRTNASKKR